MKNKLLSILLLAIAYTLPSTAQNNIPSKTTFTPPTIAPNITKVISVTVSVDSITHPTNSASDVYLKITFVTMGTGTVNYNLIDFIRQGTGTSTVVTSHTVTLNATGTEVVFIKKGTFIRSAHSFSVTTTSPNVVSSTP